MPESIYSKLLTIIKKTIANNPTGSSFIFETAAAEGYWPQYLIDELRELQDRWRIKIDSEYGRWVVDFDKSEQEAREMEVRIVISLSLK